MSCVRSVAEEGLFEIACDLGVIESVDWAHYGRPTARVGTCDYTPRHAEDCNDSTDVLSHFSRQCPGKSSCAVAVGNGAFGADPCHNKPKWTAVVYTCSAPPPTPLPPPRQPPVPPPPPEPPAPERAPPSPRAGSFRCAAMPRAPDGNGRQILLASIHEHARSAPGRPPGPEGEPFDCLPTFCAPHMPREACLRASASDTEKRWGGAELTSCGTGYKGWRLDWSDVVIGVPVSETFLHRMDEQARRALRVSFSVVRGPRRRGSRNRPRRRRFFAQWLLPSNLTHCPPIRAAPAAARIRPRQRYPRGPPARGVRRARGVVEQHCFQKGAGGPLSRPLNRTVQADATQC